MKSRERLPVSETCFTNYGSSEIQQYLYETQGRSPKSVQSDATRHYFFFGLASSPEASTNF